MNLQDKLSPPPPAHRFLYRVPYSETDAMGRVYYANYWVWFERARTEMLRDAGFAYRRMEERGIFLPVRQCAARYLGYAIYDDEVELFTWVTGLRRARVEITTVVKKGGAVITVGAVELACVDKTGKPREWDDEIMNVLRSRLVLPAGD
ncbi:MAG: acyl-CoA thioesterase [Planctomycetota bacterium]|jgi:acyl-CoA thioester hydrolase|nr:acyl-CoA thioesterase [Planctomycetota bacterium]